MHRLSTMPSNNLYTHLAVTLPFNTPTSQSMMCSSAYTSRVLQGDTLTLHAGSPLSVIHHLQLGVWSFLASPAQGLKEGTRGGRLNLPRLADGFVEGARSLASNVVLAVSSATAKTTSAARKALISLGLDQLEVTGQLPTALLHRLPWDVLKLQCECEQNKWHKPIQCCSLREHDAVGHSGCTTTKQTWSW